MALRWGKFLFELILRELAFSNRCFKSFCSMIGPPRSCIYLKIKPSMSELRFGNVLRTYQCRIRSARLDWNTSRCLFLIAVNYWRVKQVVPNTAYLCFTFFLLLSALREQKVMRNSVLLSLRRSFSQRCLNFLNTLFTIYIKQVFIHVFYEERSREIIQNVSCFWKCIKFPWKIKNWF